VETLSIFNSSSANGRAPELSAHLSFGIAFEMEDVALEETLRSLTLARPDLYEADDGSAAVIVTDRTAPVGDFRPRVPVVRVGADRGAPGQMVIDSLDPALILAAATLAAAGYRIERERKVSEDIDAPHLSQREQQVAELLAEGASNKVIARELGISVHTAKFHVTAVMEKLGARNRSDAVAISLREGLVTL
jgi:DNA-binding NarL/FixJ family response regulator